MSDPPKVYRDDWSQSLQQLHEQNEQLRAENERLKAENERLARVFSAWAVSPKEIQ